MCSPIRTRLNVLALVAVVPLAFACGPGEQDGGPPAAGAAADSGEAEMPPAVETAVASLTPQNESGVSGEVKFTHDENLLTVELAAENLGEAGEYASHIHQGTCDEPGAVVVQLTSVAVTEGGAGEAHSEIDATPLMGGNSYLVMVHDLDGAPVACAELPAPVVPR